MRQELVHLLVGHRRAVGDRFQAHVGGSSERQATFGDVTITA